ncbi:MAG: hypothetical protein DBY25_01605 [Clostridiales bacterium]|nr:MAG: hypothetical protein DBY25_01605 [Clostridiales bacterium]
MIFTEGIALYFMGGVGYGSYVDCLYTGGGNIFPLLTAAVTILAVCLFLLHWICRSTDLFWILWRQGGTPLYLVTAGWLSCVEPNRCFCQHFTDSGLFLYRYHSADAV